MSKTDAGRNGKGKGEQYGGTPILYIGMRVRRVGRAEGCRWRTGSVRTRRGASSAAHVPAAAQVGPQKHLVV